MSAKLDFILNKNPYGDGSIFKSDAITLQSGITVLVGCNGSGKSTMIREVEDECARRHIPYTKFDNLSNGGTSNYDRILEGFIHGTVDDIASMHCSSEGEKIAQNIGLYINKVHQAAAKCDDWHRNIVILYDAVDSGASIDTIRELKDVFRFIIKHQKETNNIDTYVVISANSYEMARKENCLDVYKGEYCSFDSYDDYSKFIMSTRKRKDARYKRWAARDAKRKEKEKNDIEEKATEGATAGRSHRRNFSLSRDCD